ncbi:MAG TPA: hypothetical protein VNT92_12470, partial [Acidimicrobiia bacterium]|nr:hypothetical protein [Acidimicrobiia bacterium]
PFEKAVKQADAVFVGEVASSEPVDGRQRFMGMMADELVSYSFAVEEVVAGDVGSGVEVISHSSTATCGFPFQQGDRYVVFADERDGRLETYLCSRTEPINETVTFGGEPPTGETRAGTPSDIETEAGLPLAIWVGAALLGLGMLAVLLQRLLPRRR